MSSLLQYNENIGLKDGEEASYIELRIPDSRENYGSELEEAIEYLQENFPEETRVRDDAGYDALGYGPEVMMSNPGEMGLNHVLSGSQVTVENLKAALNQD